MDPIKRLQQLLNAWPYGDVGAVTTLWQVDLPRGGTITAYGVCGKVFLLTEYEGGGWDFYLPATDGNDAQQELQAVTKYLVGWSS